jgi:hypothetical protein
VVGLILLLACLVTPLARFMMLGPPNTWALPNRASATALAAALAINVIDAVLDSMFLIPLLIAAGGLMGVDARLSPDSAAASETGHAHYKVR